MRHFTKGRLGAFNHHVLGSCDSGAAWERLKPASARIELVGYQCVVCVIS